MKILLVNNTFGNFGGGSEKATLETGNVLQKHGHEVFYFASDRKPFYIDNYLYQDFFPKNSKKIFYNSEAKIKLDLFIKKIKPDLIHINCFQHNLTSSVLSSCHESKIPTVMTLHDSNFACPAGTLVKNGKFCAEQDCIKGQGFSCIKNRCFNGSFIKSMVSVSDFSFRREMNFYHIPKYVICPSKFIMNLAIKAGFQQKKLVLINNFIDSCGEEINHHNGYFLYAGRIVKEKGIEYLAECFKQLPDIKLKIAGSGSYTKQLKRFIQKNKIKNIELIGIKKGAELDEEYKNCIATILPSIGAEAFGLSILESFSFNKPVIATKIGGITEVISDYKDGILVEAGNTEALRQAVLKLWNNPSLVKELGENARLKCLSLYNSELYYKKLIDVYTRAIMQYAQYDSLKAAPARILEET